jgi:hypothetical protein
VFIDHPFVTRARVGTFHAMSLWALSGAVSTAALTTGSIFSTSKLLPASRPIRFMRARIGSSVTWGPWTFRSSAA